MGTGGDTGGTDGSPRQKTHRIFVPEGPFFDGLVAPDGLAVRLSIQAAKAEARWLRRVRPRPFGFAAGSSHPEPATIGQAHGPATPVSGLATLLGSRTPVWTMKICYGGADPPRPRAWVITDFHRDMQDRDVRHSLLTAAADWSGARVAGWWADETDIDDSNFATGTADIRVDGHEVTVTVVEQSPARAFQLWRDGVLITVVARDMTEFPELARLNDLEPMLTAMENVDRNLVASVLAEERRRQIEEMRRQQGRETE